MPPASSSTRSSARPTLRERRRQDLTAEIKTVARRQMADSGLAALSLRAVAREVGMAVSALYRYFGSRDELVTALLVDAFTAVADHVEARVTAAGADPVDGLRAAMTAFREWSVANPSGYGLMYGTPLPDYVAPPDRLLAVGTRVGALLYRLVDEADRAGRLEAGVARDRLAALPVEHVDQVDAWRRRRVPQMRLEAVVVTVDMWTRLQGLLSMEVFGQLAPVLTDAGPYFAAAVETALRDAGLADPATR
jgi:AcrR family transcriptional regulator